MILNSLCPKRDTAKKADDTIYVKPLLEEQPGIVKDRFGMVFPEFNPEVLSDNRLTK